MEWSKSLSNLVLSVYGITFIIGVPANILAFYTFIRKVRLRATPIDVLLLSLTTSDLVFLFFLPFRMVEAANMRWDMPYFLCPLSGFIFYSTIYNSTLLLTAISVERYLGVAFPIQYKLKRRPLYAAIASAVFAVVSMAQCSIVYIMQYYDHKNPTAIAPSGRNTCYEVFSTEQLEILIPVRLELFLVMFLIPFLICCFCYISFVRILSRLPNISPKKRFRAIGLALGTLLIFIICFMPYNISHVEGFVNWKSADWRVYALLTSTFNACLDPLVFYFSSSALREMCNHFIKKLLRRPVFASCRKAMYCSAVEESTQSSNDSSR
ncbi:free fatty acid receptor 2 [Chanos chanos]|uniref:Free fatty acid receptor 2 n=1 Tax=Chanos chanos TaxID=29144 RepID=A0A6J2W257_CHACN|nr:free fatty acid receptor 2-like [Chanos chanos]